MDRNPRTASYGYRKGGCRDSIQFYAAGELSRRGYATVVTLGNPLKIDVLCGNKAAALSETFKDSHLRGSLSALTYLKRTIQELNEMLYPFGWDDVFISYSSDGAKYAEGVARELGRKGISPYLMAESEYDSINRAIKINPAIKHSMVFVLIGTAGALASQRIEKEIKEFKNMERDIVPIYLRRDLEYDFTRQFDLKEFTPEYDEFAPIDRYPSTQVISRIVKSFNVYRHYRKVRRVLRRMIWASLLVAILLLSGATGVSAIIIKRANDTVLAQAQGTPTPTPIINPSVTASPSPALETETAAIEREELRQRYIRSAESNAILTLLKSIVYAAGALGLGLSGTAFTWLFFWWRRKFESKLEGKPATKILSDLHSQALQDVRMFSVASLGVSILGIGIIFLGVVLAYLGNVPAGQIAALSGVVTEAIAGLFFLETRQRRKRVEVIEDKLHKQDLLNQITNEQIADLARASVVTGVAIPPRRRSGTKKLLAVKTKPNNEAEGSVT